MDENDDCDRLDGEGALCEFPGAGAAAWAGLELQGEGPASSMWWSSSCCSTPSCCVVIVVSECCCCADACACAAAAVPADSVLLPDWEPAAEVLEVELDEARLAC